MVFKFKMISLHRSINKSGSILHKRYKSTIINNQHEYSKLSNELINKYTSNKNNSKHIEIISKNEVLDKQLMYSRNNNKSLCNVYIKDHFYPTNDCEVLCNIIRECDLQYIMISNGERSTAIDESLLTMLNMSSIGIIYNILYR